ncbi:lipopolysaccharide assembly protein LapB [Motilimonas eburnea]|uniref:lipopolysaccharide assembly protein LapB n=1 Tax=Motilimonas eburnea TaxID=1737488 RepID=UPI001E3114D4|nr:lipopolysaccharide assembly protein LapB [Motilimonas eburnea]MCE2572540.1 lipopolysaccharide assembly protein LapB [Motilimonas eburnea]
MLELLFLLLPIAAGYGWYMGRRGLHQSEQRHSNKLSRDYVTGLNFLLSDQPDKAVDLFIDLLEVDSETIETHLALGNLFRQRGEVDRAIRIHQNLIARPSLTAEQKHLAMLQLAKDYTAAGLIDRSEALFLQLVLEPDYKVQSLQQLLQIYQQTKEWRKAIKVAQQLQKCQVKTAVRDIAHFHCELANEAHQNKENKQAIAELKKALQVDPRCVRASIGLADLYIEQQDYKQAVKYLSQVAEQDIDFVSEIIERLALCFNAYDDQPGLIEWLDQAWHKGAGASVGIKIAQYIAEHQGPESGEDAVAKQLVKNPTMKGFYQLMVYHLELAEEGRAKTSLDSLRKLVLEQLKMSPKCRCRKCGFATRSIFWQCPSCKTWGSVKPIRGLDGE